MPRGVIIPEDEADPITVGDFARLKDYHEAIHGYIEIADLSDPDASIYFDEEGKLKSLKLNRRATLLLWMHNPAFRNRDVIVGNAVVVGQPDYDGETTDIPQELEERLLGTNVYKIEVQTTGDGDKWNSNQRQYDSWVDAYNDGLSLAERWLAVEAVRVVAA